MREIGKRLLLAAVAMLTSGQARAEMVFPECETPESVRTRVTACSANSIAAESARQCYQQLVKAWQDAPRDLNRIMSVAKARNASRQQAELEFSKTDYEKTIAKLRKLLAVTEENTRRVADYPLAMLHDPDFPELDCYVDPFNAVQEIVYQLDDRITEGERTLAAAEGLHGTSDLRERYVGTDSVNRLGGRRVFAAGSGQAGEEASDVTGLREDKGKRAGAKATLEEQGRLAKEAFSDWEKWRAEEAAKVDEVLRARARSLPPVVSAGTREALEVFSRPGGVPRDLQAELGTSDVTAVSFQPSTNDTAQLEAPSVGAILFRERSEGASPLKVEFKQDEVLASPAPELAPSATVSSDFSAVGKIEEGAGGKFSMANGSLTELAGSTGGSESGKGSRAPASPASPASRAADDSLFAMVSERYRSTELFRRARVTTIPLSAFEARLSR